MSEILDNIRARWADLNSESSTENITARYRIGGSASFGVFLLIKYPQKAPAIELGPIGIDIVKSSPLPAMKGLKQGLSTEADKIYLTIDLKIVSAIDVFLILAARLCEELDGIRKPITAYNKIHNVLFQWQSFFASDRKALSRARQIGLAGELLLILKALDKEMDPDDLLKSWKGSERKHHDFQFDGFALEVKSTTANKTDEIEITSLRQLDNTGAGDLYLSQVLLDEHEYGDQALPDLVAKMRKAYRSLEKSALDLEEKLLMAGYQDKDANDYVSPSYTLRLIKSYLVDESFPKLTGNDIPDGVLEASYKISVANLQDNVLGFDTLLDRHEGEL